MPVPERHTILGGKVYVYNRPNSNLWQCQPILRARTGASAESKAHWLGTLTPRGRSCSAPSEKSRRRGLRLRRGTYDAAIRRARLRSEGLGTLNDMPSTAGEKPVA
jgi:hypothetical protein